MNKLKMISIIIFLAIIILIQNWSFARYYEALDTIKVRFTIEEKLNVGENRNYDITEL